MQIGFDVTYPDLVLNKDDLVRIVVQGEKLGFDYFTFNDHLVSPLTVSSKYPYDASGQNVSLSLPRHEQLTTIAFLAAKTHKLRFVTSVMVAPYRPAVLTAKILSTIDNLSGGRLTLGAGTGWMKDEFEVLGAPDFSKRGRVTDEYLEAFKSLWTEAEPQYEGEHVSFSGIAFEPKPVQKPHPPIWVGGVSTPAMRRAARLGDAWYPVPDDQSSPLDSFGRLQAGIAKLKVFTEDSGRDPESIAVALRLHAHGDHLPSQASDGERTLFSGSYAEIAGDIQRVRDLGLCAIDFRFAGNSADDVRRAMERFHRDVITKI